MDASPVRSAVPSPVRPSGRPAARSVPRAALLLSALLLGPAAAGGGELTLEISGVDGREGDLRLALYDSAETFLNGSEMRIGIRIRAALLGADPVILTLGDVTPGRYALSVHHDADGDGERDANLLGVPTEGFAFSRDARGHFGPPSFADAAFDLGDAPLRVRMRMDY